MLDLVLTNDLRNSSFLISDNILSSKLILILSASFNLIVQTSYASSAMPQSMRYPVPNGFMHLFLNDLVYYVTSSDNIINLANLSKASFLPPISAGS